MEWDPKYPTVPVDKDGNWISYPYDYKFDRWEAVEPFYAVFEIDGMRTGRSSKVVVLKNVDTEKTCPMFVADMVKGVQNGDFRVVNGPNGVGQLIGTWTASKRGANYGIKAVRW